MRQTFLFVRDVDIETCSELTEKFVREFPFIDCVVVLGPFVTIENWKVSPERHAMAKGEISSILACLENIVCRVVYLPSESDPASMLGEFEHFTPNSINIHARRLPLRGSLFLTGYCETEADLQFQKSSTPPMEALGEGVEHSTAEALPTIEQLLVKGQEEEASRGAVQSGIVLFDYKYAHSLNMFLFHMSELFQRTGVSVCVVPRHQDARLRSGPVGSLTVLALPSLRSERKYIIAEMEETADGVWKVVSSREEDLSTSNKS